MPRKLNQLKRRPFRCATIGCKSEGQLHKRGGEWYCRKCNRALQNKFILARTIVDNQFRRIEIVNAVCDRIEKEVL